MGGHDRRLLRLLDRQREVLVDVVGQHELGDLVGHRLQQLDPLGVPQPALGDRGLQQDLDVDLVAGGVHARRVVDEVGVDPAAGFGVFDASQLGPAQVAALAGDAGADTGELPADQTPGGSPAPTPAPGDTAPPAPGTGQVDEAAAVTAMQKAEQAFTEAEAALRNGDLATYQSKTNEAKVALEDALKKMGR